MKCDEMSEQVSQGSEERRDKSVRIRSPGHVVVTQVLVNTVPPKAGDFSFLSDLHSGPS